MTYQDISKKFGPDVDIETFAGLRGFVKLNSPDVYEDFELYAEWCDEQIDVLLSEKNQKKYTVD